MVTNVIVSIGVFCSALLIGCLWQLCRDMPREIVTEITDDERAEAGENARYTVLGRMFE